ncbi:PREDICTED: TMV resistance [Prunus dulcis]|uniref:PREDICTED: TMV resistance n=1 Tax=Prunus dulcis TaxID=3755 RepID=A0A5E4G3X9_PRUDU|nr:PREDICTED: TMV resistance [Prunus dulcis]
MIFCTCGLLEKAEGLYEDGIFSTFFGGNEVPGQFSHKSKGSSISFAVPLLDNHGIKGLNVFAVYECFGSDFPYYEWYSMSRYFVLMGVMIRVRNKSEGLKWDYSPTHYGIPDEGEDMIWLSHWKFKDEHLESGDQVVVSVDIKHCFQVNELGIQFVQVEQESHNMMSTTDISDYVHKLLVYTIHPGSLLVHKPPWHL